MKLYRRTRIVFLLAAAVLLSAAVYAQPSGPGGGNGGDPDAPVPLDGGVSILVAAAIGYGARRRYQEFKQKQSKERDSEG